MNLTYRGNSYNYNFAKVKALFPTQPKIKLVTKLMYRGNTYQIDRNITAVKPISYNLMYRGNPYQTN